MSSKKGLSIPFVIIAIIVGSAIYKQFDFENLKFQKPALATVYIITFLLSVLVIVRNLRAK